jgi:putative Mn2+ efflux pump MntP
MMLTGGWFLGSYIVRLLHGLDAWVAFALLALVGGNIVRNALRNEKLERRKIDPTRGWELIFLSVASSLDALAVGISMAMVNFLILALGARGGRGRLRHDAAGPGIGRKIGTIWGRRCELIGGIVLIFMGFYFLWPWCGRCASKAASESFRVYWLQARDFAA